MKPKHTWPAVLFFLMLVLRGGVKVLDAYNRSPRQEVQQQAQKEAARAELAENRLRLWDTVTGRILQTFPVDDCWINTAVFTPDGKQIITGGSDRTVRVWNVAEGKEVARLTGFKQAIRLVALSTTGRLVAAADYTGHIKVWDREANRDLPTFEYAPPAGTSTLFTSLRFTPQADRLLGVTDNSSVKLWSIADKKEVFSIDSKEGRIVLNGRWLAVYIPDKIIVCDLDTGHRKATLSVPAKTVSALSISPAGDHLGVGDETGKVWVMSITGSKEPMSIPAHTQPVVAVEFAPDGKRLFSATSGRVPEQEEWKEHPAEVREWDVSTGTHRRNLDCGDHHFLESLDVVGCFLTAGRTGNELVWDLADGNRWTIELGWIGKDPRRMVAKGEIVDYMGRRPAVPLQGPATLLKGGFHFVRFSPDGTRFVAGIGPDSW